MTFRKYIITGMSKPRRGCESGEPLRYSSRAAFSLGVHRVGLTVINGSAPIQRQSATKESAC